MDRGAARSRKRAAQVDIPSQSTAVAPLPSTLRNPVQSKSKKPLPRPKVFRPRLKESTDDPNQYKPKAIRTASALIYIQSPFPLPPPRDLLKNVRRVDLAGSGCTDVSWLEGSGVTWLSLSACEIKEGWEAVGALEELSGMFWSCSSIWERTDSLSVLNISQCGLKSLPEELKGLKKLKAVVAMYNEWTELDGGVVSCWTEINSLSKFRFILNSTRLSKSD